MQSNNKDLYFVAVKVFLEDGKGNFLITKDRFSCWDIPGGRLRPEDFDVEIIDVVVRKLGEELGDEVVYYIHEPIVYMRHERDEIIAHNETEKCRIFAIAYRATYKNGNILLGENHVEYKWVSQQNFDAEKYFDGGWLKGVREYMEKIKKYMK